MTTAPNRSQSRGKPARKPSAAQVRLAAILKEASALQAAFAPMMADYNKVEDRCATKLHRLASRLQKAAPRMSSSKKARIHNRLLQLETFSGKANTTKQLRQLEAALDGMLGGHNYGPNLSDNRAYYDANDDGQLDIPTGDEGQSAILSVGKDPSGSAIYPRTAAQKGRRRLADLFDVDPFGMGDVEADSAIMNDEADEDSAITADIYPDGSLPHDDWSEDLYADMDMEECEADEDWCDEEAGMGMDFADLYGEEEDCEVYSDDVNDADMTLELGMETQEAGEDCEEAGWDLEDDMYADLDEEIEDGMADLGDLSEGMGLIDDMEELDLELEEMTARLARRNLRRPG